MTAPLLELFAAHSGIVSLVGAGGKKTTLYRLADVHPGRVGITATVFTPPFRKRLAAEIVVADSRDLEQAVIKAAAEHRRVAYARPSEKRARLRGVDPDKVAALHDQAGFDVTLVKADGARLRWLKAPGEYEPALPPGTTTVVHVISIRALGRPLNADLVHRPEEMARILGGQLGQMLTASQLARFIASDRGGLKNVGDAKFISLINMVENREQARVAHLIAEQALDLSDRITRVVIGAMAAEDIHIEVVERN